MEAHVLVQSYDTYGAHSSISAIGDLLEHAARDVDCGVAVFEATACFSTNRLRQAHSERRLAERSLLPWWEQLGVDWGQYHPAARHLLNDPFFWREVDDYSPHGNDTGADLLSEFRTWRRSHEVSPPIEFLQLALRRWGFSMEWKRLPLEQWDSDVELAMHTYDDAAVALAFALIKLEGSCDATVRAAAVEAIGRERDPTVAAHFRRKVTPERSQALNRLAEALESERPDRRVSR